MRTFPLPLYFAAYGTVLSTFLALGWTIQLDPGTPGHGNDPGEMWNLLAVVALPVAALLTVREANRRKLADAGQGRYRLAVRLGQPIGDVSGWSERIGRDRHQVFALAVGSVLGVGWWGVQAFLYGPWWLGAAMALLSSCGGWLAWRVLRTLNSLSQYVAATAIEPWVRTAHDRST
jgi:hypothetical protein